VRESRTATYRPHLRAMGGLRLIGLLLLVIFTFFYWNKEPLAVKVSGIVLLAMIVGIVVFNIFERVVVMNDSIEVRNIRGNTTFRANEATWRTYEVNMGFILKRPGRVVTLLGNDGKKADLVLFRYRKEDGNEIFRQARRLFKKSRASSA
jgi:hypothetical protein